jgi:hypothetical protein
LGLFFRGGRECACAARGAFSLSLFEGQGPLPGKPPRWAFRPYAPARLPCLFPLRKAAFMRARALRLPFGGRCPLTAAQPRLSHPLRTECAAFFVFSAPRSKPAHRDRAPGRRSGAPFSNGALPEGAGPGEKGARRVPPKTRHSMPIHAKNMFIAALIAPAQGIAPCSGMADPSFAASFIVLPLCAQFPFAHMKRPLLSLRAAGRPKWGKGPACLCPPALSPSLLPDEAPGNETAARRLHARQDA